METLDEIEGEGNVYYYKFYGIISTIGLVVGQFSNIVDPTCDIVTHYCNSHHEEIDYTIHND